MPAFVHACYDESLRSVRMSAASRLALSLLSRSSLEASSTWASRRDRIHNCLVYSYTACEYSTNFSSSEAQGSYWKSKLGVLGVFEGTMKCCWCLDDVEESDGESESVLSGDVAGDDDENGDEEYSESGVVDSAESSYR